MAKNIVNLKIDGTSYSARPYGTCTTASGTAAKAVTCADFSLTTGATILVKFTYANSVASPTLNVNSTGAKPIYYRGAALGSSLYYWGANDTVEFYYNGTQWDLMDVGNTNSTYANYSFGNGYATCATAEATTAKVATYQYYSLATGGIVAVKFTYAVPANATLNINSKGAKSIYYNNAAITAGVIGAGDIATFVYDGTNYVLLAVDNIMTAAEKTKLGGIAAGAQVNQNAFASVQYGNDTSSVVTAAAKSDVLKLSGSGIDLTYDAGRILFKHADTSTLSGSYGPTANVTGTNNTTIVIPQITVDGYGHVTGVTNRTYTSKDTNTNYYPTKFTWSNGTSSAGPTGSLTGSGMSAVSFGAIPTATTSRYGVVKLSGSVNNSSDSEAATAGAVNAAYQSLSALIEANKYTLPNATSSTLGGVKIGNNISVSSGTISLTKSNVTSALGYTPPTTSADSRYTQFINAANYFNDDAGYIIPSETFFNNAIWLDDPGNHEACLGFDNGDSMVLLYTGKEWIKDGNTPSSLHIPYATQDAAGVMSAADKQRLDQPFTGLVDGKGETVTMTSSPIDPIVPINEYLNLSLRALPGISVAFATYNSNAVVASPHLYKQAQRCAIVLDKSQLSTIDYQTITWRTSAISGYGTPWSEQGGYSLIYIPSGYQSITFKHTSDHYNISAVGVHPTKLGGGYIFNGEWQDANVARTITLNNSDLYVILQAKKADDSDIDPKLDILSELGLSITLNRTDNNICRGFVLNDGTQVYPVFKSAQNNDFNRICYYTNLSGNAAKPKLGDILDCLAVYCHSLPYGYYKIIVQPPNNAREKYGVFDVLVSQDQSYSECKYLDVTAMINLNSVSDMSDLPFGHIWGQINTEPDMAGAYSFQSMYSNEWVYER